MKIELVMPTKSTSSSANHAARNGAPGLRRKGRREQERLERIEKELAELREKSAALKAQWQNEKKVIDESRKLQEQLEQLRLDLERAQRTGDLAEASEIQYGHIPAATRELEKHNAKLAEMQRGGTPMLKEEVTEEDIAKVVSAWTGIPVTNLRESEREKLVSMEDRLAARVIGQRRAITAVSKLCAASRRGRNRPSLVHLPGGAGQNRLSKRSPNSSSTSTP